MGYPFVSYTWTGLIKELGKLGVSFDTSSEKGIDENIIEIHYFESYKDDQPIKRVVDIRKNPDGTPDFDEPLRPNTVRSVCKGLQVEVGNLTGFEIS